MTTLSEQLAALGIHQTQSYEQQISSLRTLRKIVEDTKDLPDDTLIYTQVTGSEANSGAWMMNAHLIKTGMFNAGLILNITHPSLKRLTPTVEIDKD